MSGDLPADDPEAEGGVGVIVGSGRVERVNRPNRLLQVFKARVRSWHPLKSLSKLENLALPFESQSCDTAPGEWKISGVANDCRCCVSLLGVQLLARDTGNQPALEAAWNLTPS